jgi:hypothetical protein
MRMVVAGVSRFIAGPGTGTGSRVCVCAAGARWMPAWCQQYGITTSERRGRRRCAAAR